MNISKFWENTYPFSVINLPHGIQGPIYNILSLPKGVRSSAAMKYRISKFLNPMGAVYLLRRWRIASVTAYIYIGASKLCHHWLGRWLVTWAVPIYLIITTADTGSWFCEKMSVNIIKMRRLPFKKMYLKMPSVKWQPVLTGLNVLANSTVHSEMHTRNIAGLLISSLTRYIWKQNRMNKWMK